MARDREYEKQAARYTRFIVQGGRVVSGWEYPEDAREALSNMKAYGEIGDAKIVARASLAKYGIDPRKPFGAPKTSPSAGSRYVVRSYDDGRRLEGSPSADLVRRSLAAGETGAVPAYEDGGLWFYISPSRVDHARLYNGLDVITVYVEERPAGAARSPSAAKHEAGGNPRTSRAVSRPTTRKASAGRSLEFHVYAPDGFESAHRTFEAARRAAERGQKRRRMAYKVLRTSSSGLTGGGHGTEVWTGALSSSEPSAADMKLAARIKNVLGK